MNKLKNRSVLIPLIVILAVVISMGVGGYLLIIPPISTRLTMLR
jgi:hypothetical protein